MIDDVKTSMKNREKIWNHRELREILCDLKKK